MLLAAGGLLLTSGDSQYEYEISLACQGLPNDSSGLEPNTYAVVQCQNEAGGSWISNGHTETVEVYSCFFSISIMWLVKQIHFHGLHLKAEFKAKKLWLHSNEHLRLIKLHILHESDNLCWINTMFEDLFLTVYLLIMIVQKRWFFLRMQLHIIWWACLMLSLNIDHYGAFSTWIRPRTGIYCRRTVFSLLHFMLKTLTWIKLFTNLYLHVVCFDLI